MFSEGALTVLGSTFEQNVAWWDTKDAVPLKMVGGAAIYLSRRIFDRVAVIAGCTFDKNTWRDRKTAADIAVEKGFRVVSLLKRWESFDYNNDGKVTAKELYDLLSREDGATRAVADAVFVRINGGTPRSSHPHRFGARTLPHTRRFARVELVCVWWRDAQRVAGV